MKKQRLRTNFAWDAIYHTAQQILAEPIHSGDPEIRSKFLDVFNEVQNKCSDGGKEGKFQVLLYFWELFKKDLRPLFASYCVTK